MKNLKRLTAALFAVVLIAALAACGGGKDMSGSKYLGTWTLTKGRASGIEIAASTLNMSMEFSFKADGKFDFDSDIDGDAKTSKGSWDESEKGVVLKETAGTKYELNANGDTLEMERDGVILVFELKK